MLLFEEIVPGVKRLKSPFSDSWSGIVLIKGTENILIDSGASAQVVDDFLIPALKAEGLKPDDIHWLLNTHCHGDHIGGHYRFRQRSKAKIAAWRGSLDKMRDPLKYSKLIRARFPEFSPPPPPVLNGVEPDILLNDNEVVAERLRLLHTPGHDNDTVCWLDEATKTLISGDTLQANGTVLQGIGFYQDLTAYRSSLQRLLAMQMDNLITGHDYIPCGSVAIGREKVKTYLEKCLYLTELYDKFTAEIMAHGEREPTKIARRLIKQAGGTEPEYLFLALYTVSEHIKAGINAQ
ncbi:MAG: MBL fold metallo-hydrolase [Victivallales bacterium]|nr:MBL fold metallo-hydrolase [Victivallales bacterium]